MSDLNAQSRRNAKQLAVDLAAGFMWIDTPQGHNYWSAVHQNLDFVAAGDTTIAVVLKKKAPAKKKTAAKKTKKVRK